jgi:N-acetylneuraminic acid mutarotase
VASAEIYDPVAGTWTRTGSLITARESHTATLLHNGTVLVAGGDNNVYAGGFQLGVLASAEIYDPSTSTWTPTGALRTARTIQTATLLSDGAVLAVGGYGAQVLADAANVLASAELYDSTTGTWTSTGALETARVTHTATLLPNGTVLAVGGIYVTLTYTSSAEIYDPVSRTWTSTGSLANARGGHAATLLGNGTVLVTGGLGNANDLLGSAEIYY